MIMDCLDVLLSATTILKARRVQPTARAAARRQLGHRQSSDGPDCIAGLGAGIGKRNGSATHQQCAPLASAAAPSPQSKVTPQRPHASLRGAGISGRPAIGIGRAGRQIPRFQRS
jgi:hypothetical protein